MLKALFYRRLAEGPGVARGKKIEIKNSIFLTYNTLRPPMSVHKKFQPNRSSRLAGYTQHIFKCFIIVLLLEIFLPV